MFVQCWNLSKQKVWIRALSVVAIEQHYSGCVVYAEGLPEPIVLREYPGDLIDRITEVLETEAPKNIERERSIEALAF